MAPWALWLSGFRLALSTSTDSWELSTLAHKLKNIRDHLKKQLVLCHQHIGRLNSLSLNAQTRTWCSADKWLSLNAEEKRDIESFQMLINLFEMTHLDNMKVLKALIYAKDDLQPLVDGSTGQRVWTSHYCKQNSIDISNSYLSLSFF